MYIQRCFFFSFSQIFKGEGIYMYIQKVFSKKKKNISTKNLTYVQNFKR